MKTSDIENEANRGNIATGDFDIHSVLRFQVIPQFIEDCGRVGWRRKTASLVLSPQTRQVDLPADFAMMGGVWQAPYEPRNELPYIGESDHDVIQAEQNTTPGKPSGFYLVNGATDPTKYWALRVDGPVDQQYILMAVYYFGIYFNSSLLDIELSTYIPLQWHWALVHLLRRAIYEDRYSEKDERYLTADKQYQEVLKNIKARKEMARRNKEVYVR